MTLEDLRAIKSMKAGITAFSLGEVTYYNSKKHTADVKLYILKNPVQQEGALLREVPILKGFGGKSFCFSPLQEGDLVILGFCSHPMAELQRKNPIFVQESHNHQDCVILGTLNPLGEENPNPQLEGLLMGFKNSFMQITEQGLNIKIGSSTLEITENKIKLGAIEITQSDITVGNISLNNHTHTQGTYTTPNGGPVTGVSGGPI